MPGPSFPQIVGGLFLLAVAWGAARRAASRLASVETPGALGPAGVWLATATGGGRAMPAG